MKPEIHPAYKEIKVACSCGNSFVTGSTLDHDLHIEICAKCHPFYTGTQKLIDTAGRVDRFRQKYGQSTKSTTTEAKPTKPIEAAKPATTTKAVASKKPAAEGKKTTAAAKKKKSE